MMPTRGHRTREGRMELGLKGRRVAILATHGVEQVELEEPRRALDGAGAVTHLISQEEGSIQAMIHDDRGARIPVDRVLGTVRPSDYDTLLLPGGVARRLRGSRVGGGVGKSVAAAPGRPSGAVRRGVHDLRKAGGGDLSCAL